MSSIKKKFGKQKPFDYYEVPESGFRVYSWCPTPEPTVPATQVHLQLPFANGRLLIRFKSPNTLDQLIVALIRHREDVFGKLTEERLGEMDALLSEEAESPPTGQITNHLPEEP